MLFHCGLRKMFPLVSAAVSKLIPLERLRWLGFGHFEADECGSMNEWLAAAPRAELMHGTVGCRVSVADMADRAPRVLADQEVIEIGGRRFAISTHRTCRTAGTQVSCSRRPRALCFAAISSHALATARRSQKAISWTQRWPQRICSSHRLGPSTAPNVRKLADLNPKMLATMHGSSFRAMARQHERTCGSLRCASARSTWLVHKVMSR